MSGNIVRIQAEIGSEPCGVDMDILHETLLMLPADLYIELYRKMQKKMEKTPIVIMPQPQPIDAEEAMRMVGFSQESINRTKKQVAEQLSSQTQNFPKKEGYRK